MHQPPSEEYPDLPDDIEEPCEEESAHDRVKDRIGRIVVSPVLVAPEIVLDEAECDGFAERP